jgi:WD40 repeat protein
MGKLFIFLLFPIFLISDIITPHRAFEASGTVFDFIIKNEKIYAGTSVGIVDIFNLKNGKIIEQIKIPPFENFYGEEIKPKIYSVDLFKNHLLILSESKMGGRDVYLKKSKKPLEKLFHSSSPIKKAKLINDVLFIYATLGNEIVLYDIWDKMEVYKRKISSSPFSDFQINGEKIAISSESGDIEILNIWTGKTLSKLKGENVDNVYKVAFKGDTVLGAGQDRRLSIYKISENKSFHIQGDFLIYSVGISPDEVLGAFPFNEKNEIKVFNVQNGKAIHILKGQNSLLNKIEFLNSKQIFSSSDDKFILDWRIP